jgi:hypothetical protein
MKKSQLLLASLALGTAAFAQTNAPQATPAAPAPAVAAPAIDAAKLALARDVITAMQADKLIERMTVQMKQMAVQMSGLSPDMPADKRARAEATQGKIMELSMEMTKTLLSKMDAVYAEVFSEPELKAMKAFYSSPEGASAQLKQAEVAKRMMPLVQELQRGLMPKFQQIMADAQAEETRAAAAAVPAPTPAAKPAEPAK